MDPVIVSKDTCDLFHVSAAAQGSKRPAEVDNKLEDVVINKYLSVSHTALKPEPITEKHDNDSSTNRKIYHRKCPTCLDGSENQNMKTRHHKSAPRDR